MAFLRSTRFNLGHGPGREQRQAGFLDVILDPYFLVVGIGTALSVLSDDEDDCWQVTAEGLSVSHHQFPWYYFLVIL